MVPTLVLPPQAGHDSCIVDYAPGQSQVLTVHRGRAARAVYSLDWVGATHGDEGLLDRGLRRGDLSRPSLHIGGHVNLVGDCQGGWLATDLRRAAPGHGATRSRSPARRSTSTPANRSSTTGCEAGSDGPIDFYRGARRRQRRRAAGRRSCSTASC